MHVPSLCLRYFETDTLVDVKISLLIFPPEYKKWISEVEQTAAPPLKHLTIPETELLHKAKKFAMECSVQAVSTY